MDFSKDRQWTEHNVSGLPIKNLQGPKQNYRFSGTYELGKDKNLNLDLGYYKDKLTGDWSHKEYNTGAWGCMSFCRMPNWKRNGAMPA
jgi:outer membrane receptor for ferrienterochelin and colicins